MFVLQKKDPDFLKKLAHPYASVYPKESLQADKSPIYEAIGTGGYYVAQRNKNLLILASNDNYHLEQTVPNRLDIAHGLKESDLYQQFARGELDALIEPGPGTVVQVTDTSGNIDPIFSSEFNIKKADATNTINFYYNNASQKRQLLDYLNSQDESFLSFDGALGSIQFPGKTQPMDSLIKTTAYIAFSENPTNVYLIDKIAEKLSSAGINVVMNSSYAVTDDVAFSTNNFPSATPTITWQYPVYILSKTNISGIKINAQPWNISFNGAKKSTVQ
jgi:MarR-like DNA-binding transcriptional regulator SgrR of sgrS sRNA